MALNDREQRELSEFARGDAGTFTRLEEMLRSLRDAEQVALVAPAAAIWCEVLDRADIHGRSDQRGREPPT